MWPLRGVVAILLSLSLAACPGRAQRRVGLEVPIPTDGDPSARRHFQELQAEFDRDGGSSEVDAAEFEALARRYPDDPIAAHALLYAGMAELRAGDAAAALEALEALEARESPRAAVRIRGALFRGIALNYLGRYRDAARALEEGEVALNYEDREERAEYFAALASVRGNIGDSAGAILALDTWWQVARPAERAYAVDRIRELLGDFDDASAAGTYARLEDRRGPAAAIVGERLASAAEAAGDLARARELRSEIAEAKEALGLQSAPAAADGGNPELVGALLPLSGKLNKIGDLSLRGLSVAAGNFAERSGGGVEASGFPRPFELGVRDSASVPARAEDELAVLAGDGAIAAIGPFDVRAVDAAAEAATRLGLPLVTLTPIVSRAEPSASVFHIRHSAEERARALARAAVGRGQEVFAIFGPDNSYGRAVGASFAAEVERLGARVAVEVFYPSGTTSFAAYTEKLKGPWQALFVPDLAKSLQLIAPALAAADFAARPVGQSAKHGQTFLLLSTAEAISADYLRAAGRYSWGALFAPGFYPDRSDPAAAEFIGRYEEQYGRDPTPYDAYAFDAALAVRAAVEGGAKSRRAVAAGLAGATTAGVTGDIRFNGAGRRRDDGILYAVEAAQDDYYELRAQRKK